MEIKIDGDILVYFEWKAEMANLGRAGGSTYLPRWGEFPVLLSCRNARQPGLKTVVLKAVSTCLDKHFYFEPIGYNT